jgi:energy-coupling factor transporter ATP-binding protein EcfA2
MTQSHRELEEYVREATRQLVDYVCEEGRLAVVKAPPGSGKTYLLLTAAKAAFKKGQRVAIATQTRSQADDICRRFAADFGVKPIRFAAAGTTADAGLPYLIISDKKELPTGRCIVVGTSAKWGMLGDLAEFDVMFVEEAWQLAWADFMHLGRFAGRFVLIGDPGQIPPVVTIETGRWETAPRPPHRAAPELILAEKKRWRDLLSLDLPATRRLPRDTVGYIESFYDFEFRAFARDGA